MNGPLARATTLTTAAMTAAALLATLNGASTAASTGASYSDPGKPCPPGPGSPARPGGQQESVMQPPALRPERSYRRQAVPPPGNPPVAARPPAAGGTQPGATTALPDCNPAPRPRLDAGDRHFARQPGDAGRPGAAGAGDPYFPAAGNGGYDVRHYDAALNFTPKGGHVDATVTVQGTAKADLSSFNLDYRGPKIVDVTVNGARASYKRGGQELTIAPPGGLRRGRDFTAAIRYSGRPGPVRNNLLGTYGWVPSADGAVALGEPDGAPTWLPVNDHPSDKATYTFRITVPNHLRALANGEPGTTQRNGARSTYVWNERSPMASYLAMVAIGRFDVRRATTGSTSVITAVDPRFRRSAAKLESTTIKAVRFGTQVFGRYPFATSGGIIDDPKVDYALETQERPVYGGFAPDEGFVVHEIAHQWFGDSVGLRRWRDIWLNEGFASYAEWLWQERTGKQSAKKIFQRYHRQPAGSRIYAPPPGSPGRKGLFSPSVYIRGAMTLHALRERVGDRAFFRILKSWAAERRDGHGTTPQFVALAERISGRQLDRLFKVWLFTKTKPRKW